MFLLDVNILIALADSDHPHHHSAGIFFQKATLDGWATCPLTENGFLRIFGHANYDQGPSSPENARPFLQAFCAAPGHQFWPDDISLTNAKYFPTLPNSKQLTDHYLLALAIRHKARFASFDQRIDPSILPGGAKAYYQVSSK